jgi:hypothetical protein
VLGADADRQSQPPRYSQVTQHSESYNAHTQLSGARAVGSAYCIVAERIDRQLEATYIADESISMILQYVSDIGTLIVIPRLVSGKTLDDLT